MAKVKINKKLEKEIDKKFKKESIKIFELMYSLENSPHKGKPLGHIEGIAIKELRYENFRFYFITDGHILKFGTEDEIANLLIKFIRMSDKKDQQKTINEIKNILLKIGAGGF